MKGDETMSYSINLSLITIDEYKDLLKKQNLLPGRQLLKTNIDHNFDLILKYGVDKIEQLKKILSNSAKLSMLKNATGIAEEYLLILKREMGSLEQKPVSISQFPKIDRQVIKDLENRGIKNSKDYYEIKPTIKDELYSLCDLVRINGVGAVAARMFYEAGYGSVADVAQANAESMLVEVSKVNEDKGYYKGQLGIKDMQFCIDYAILLEKYS